MGVIRQELFTLKGIGEMPHQAWSLVIPLPGNRALRVGFRFGAWCRIGPRRYTLVASKEFVKGWTRIGYGGDEEKAKDGLRSIGVKIESELSPVESADNDDA